MFSSCRDVISSARKVAGKWSLSGWEVASFGREVVLSGLIGRVRGGSHGRYVLITDQSSDSVGSLCTDCEVTAVLHMSTTLPDFLTF